MSLRNSKKIVSALAPAITALGFHHIFDKKYSGRGHILMFHRVLPRDEKIRVHNHESLEIDPEQLEQTILFFKKRNYQFLSIGDLPEYLKSQQVRKFVVFTFDDGYLDNYQYAYPIFKKHVVPFTIYITNNFINGRAVMWWYLLEEILLGNDSFTFSWQGKTYSFGCNTPSQKELVFDEVRQLITTGLNPDQYLDQLNDIFGTYLPDLLQYTRDHAMSWDQIKQLSTDTLVTIAAHTANHFPLKQLSEDQLISEIVESRTELENRINKRVDHFAYPFGKKIEAAQREYKFIELHGFKTAVTTNIGNIFSEHFSYLHRLPRVNINSMTTNEVLQLQVSGMVSFFKNGKNQMVL